MMLPKTTQLQPQVQLNYVNTCYETFAQLFGFMLHFGTYLGSHIDQTIDIKIFTHFPMRQVQFSEMTIFIWLMDTLMTFVNGKFEERDKSNLVK